jgi:hypothetical protein
MLRVLITALFILVQVVLGLSFPLAALAGPEVERGSPSDTENLRRPPNTGKPTEVSISLYLDDVSSIDVGSSVFDITGQLVLDWADERTQVLFTHDRDCKRLEYQGAAAVQKLTEIWSPQLEIMNEKGQRRTGVVALEIECDGRLKLYEKFSSTPHLKGSMHAFPFVDADLEIAFAAYSQPSAELTFSNPRFELQPGSDSEQVIAGDWTLSGLVSRTDKIIRSDGAGRSMDRALFSIQVERRAASGFVTFILPLILIAIVSCAILWLDAASIPALASPRVGGAITLMLTTVAFQLSLETKLPSVDYVILVQWIIWLTLIMLTASIAFSCAQIWLFHNQRPSLSRRLDALWRVGYPAAFMLAGFALTSMSLNNAVY